MSGPEISFRAFTGKAQDEGLNIDLVCIGLHVIKYIDGFRPVGSQVPLEYQLVTYLDLPQELPPTSVMMRCAHL